MRRLLVEKLQASVAEDRLNPGQRGGNTLQIPGCNGGMVLAARDDKVTVYLERPREPPFDRCRAPLRQLAALIDAELASGRHEAQFIAD